MIESIALALILTVQSPPPVVRVAVVQDGIVTMVTERDLEIEYRALLRLKTRTFGQHKRLAAVTVALGSIPYRCTEQQAEADLCIRIENVQPQRRQPHLN